MSFFINKNRRFNLLRLKKFIYYSGRWKSINSNLQLNVSEQFILNNNEENINLNLNPNFVNNTGSVYGTVYDTTLLGTPVIQATVKVFTSDGIPYQHTLTDVNGNYTIDNLPTGVYTIVAVKDGYILSEDIPLVITNTIPVKIDLVVLSNEIINNNILYGILRELMFNYINWLMELKL